MKLSDLLVQIYYCINVLLCLVHYLLVSKKTESTFILATLQ